jgi:hypothetical protein
MEIFISIAAIVGSFLIVSFAGSKLKEAWEKGIWNTIGLLVGVFGIYFLIPYVFTFLADTLHSATGWNPLVGGAVGTAIVIAACGGIGYGVIYILKPPSAMVKTAIWCLSLSAAGASALGLFYAAADEMTYVWVVSSIISTVVVVATIYYWREKGQDVLGLYVAYAGNLVMTDVLLWSLQGIHLWYAAERYLFALVPFIIFNLAIGVVIWVLNKKRPFGTGLAFNVLRGWTIALVIFCLTFTLLQVCNVIDRYEIEAIRAVVFARFADRDSDLQLSSGTPLGQAGSKKTFVDAQIDLQNAKKNLNRDEVKKSREALEQHLADRRRVYQEHASDGFFEPPQQAVELATRTTQVVSEFFTGSWEVIFQSSYTGTGFDGPTGSDHFVPTVSVGQVVISGDKIRLQTADNSELRVHWAGGWQTMLEGRFESVLPLGYRSGKLYIEAGDGVVVTLTVERLN